MPLGERELGAVRRGQTGQDESWPGRLERLRRRLAAFDGLAVAYSGGVDSAVLLDLATAALGARAVGLIADSPSLPRAELAQARALAESIGARLVVIATDELDDPRYRANAGDRCYYCKEALFAAMSAWARERTGLALAYGAIADDLAEDRPGARSARERGVLAPLQEAGFTKEDVRRYARERGLPVADKPASACLASRIPVGTPVSARVLAEVERAERALVRLGFRVLRVRHLGRRARVELGAAELESGLRRRAEIESALETAGFAAVEIARYLSAAERAAAAPVSSAEPASRAATGS